MCVAVVRHREREEAGRQSEHTEADEHGKQCPGLSAASVYYGGRILIPFGDGPAPIDLTNQIRIPVMGNFGQLDANPTPEDVAQIEGKLKEAGVVHDFKMYPDADHGFNCDERASYHKESANDALARTLAWFDKYVKN